MLAEDDAELAKQVRRSSLEAAARLVPAIEYIVRSIAQRNPPRNAGEAIAGFKALAEVGLDQEFAGAASKGAAPTTVVYAFKTVDGIEMDLANKRDNVRHAMADLARKRLEKPK